MAKTTVEHAIKVRLLRARLGMGSRIILPTVDRPNTILHAIIRTARALKKIHRGLRTANERCPGVTSTGVLLLSVIYHHVVTAIA